MPRGNLSSRSPMRCAPALSPPPNVFDPAGTARAPFHTGEPASSFLPRRAGVEARPYGGHQHLTDAGTNPSVTPLRAATAPLSGEPRAWAEVCGVYALVYHDADTVVFLSPVRGGVLDAPRSLDCRAALDASVRHTCASLHQAGFRLYSRAKSGSGCKNAPQKLRGVMGLFQSYSQMKPICPEYIAG